MIAFLVSGLCAGLILGLISGLKHGLGVGLMVGLSVGLSVGLIVGLSRGGAAVIRHYALRLVLWFSGYTPFQFIKFLDQCDNLILLKKVGSGYIFIHRMLLDYFADLNAQSLKAGDGHPNGHRQSDSLDEEEADAPPIFNPAPSREDGSLLQTKGTTIAAGRSQAKTKWLPAIAVIVALITGIGSIWFVAHKKRERTEGDAKVAFDHGFAYYKKGDYDEAITDYTKAIRLQPTFAEAYNERGNAYCQKEQYDKAVRDFNEAIRLRSNFAEAYNDRGNAYFEKGEYDKAISDFNEAIRLWPSFAEAYFDRGNAYENQGDLDKANADFAEGYELLKTGQ